MSETKPVNGIEKIISQIDAVTEMTGRLVSWCTLFTVLLMASIVILRYGFDIGWIAMQEATIYLHATVFMLAAAYTLKHDEHVRVDIFYRPLNPRKKAMVNIFGTVFLLFPVCGFIAISSWDYVANSWRLLEGSAEAGGIRGVFYLKTLIILVVATLALQGIAELLRNILTVRRNMEGEE